MSGHAAHIATVFGGSGFIGRHIVNRLTAAGYRVRVAVRDTEAAMFLKPMGRVGQVVLLHAPADDAAAVALAVEGADVVVNLVGILSERRAGDFTRVHVTAAQTIAAAAAKAGVGRLIHLSALGVEAGHPSAYAQSKAAGEAAVRAAFPGVTILRPSVVFGHDDKFFNLFATMAQRLPMVMPLIGGAAKMQPVYVGDVADAAMAALGDPATKGQAYDLGGPNVWSMKDIVSYVLAETKRPHCLWNVPMWIARIEAAFLEKVPGKPLTRDQLKLLERDNVVPAGAQGLAALGIAPVAVEAVVPAYLRRYRPGGGRRPGYAAA